jgi:HD superfamily phosphodiesterase
MVKGRNTKLVEDTREHFIKVMAEGNPVHNWFLHHVIQVEKWAKKIMEYYPAADKEVVMLSVWLHDIGQEYKENFDVHEIFSEKEARRFLNSKKVDEKTVNMVAHCVRTHRCKKDALPKTDEAKIVAAADSASHLTDIVYIHMLNEGHSKEAMYGKLKRDMRDIQALPKLLQKQFIPLNKAWKELIAAFPTS